MLTAKNIYKNFFDNEVINNFNESFVAGEFAAIKGESGSGKTTLLSIISTLMKPSDGRIIFKDTELTYADDKTIARFRNKHFGYIFQSANMVNHLKVWENVALPLFYSESPSISQNKELAGKYLELVNMGDMFERSVTTLSGGEQQRVAVARSLVNNPDVIFADEPTGNLDHKNTAIILDFLRKLCGQGKCVIIVTHDEQVAEKTDRVIHLSKYDNVRYS